MLGYQFYFIPREVLAVLLINCTTVYRQNRKKNLADFTLYLCRFDERISYFAEQKFCRDGIEVQTGCRVISVSDKEITMKLKSKGEICSIPHGLVVWSTGVETRPVVKDFMGQIGQVQNSCVIVIFFFERENYLY